MPTQDPLNPLDEGDYLELTKSIGDLENAIRAADKAQQAGIDMSAQKARAQQELERARNLKRTYFPGRP